MPKADLNPSYELYRCGRCGQLLSKCDCFGYKPVAGPVNPRPPTGGTGEIKRRDLTVPEVQTMCNVCFHWRVDPKNHFWGECHVGGPVANEKGDGCWPKTRDIDSCGVWKLIPLDPITVGPTALQLQERSIVDENQGAGC